MGQRLQLHEIFKLLVPNVYFQPPSSEKMSYDCILYELDDIQTDYANNSPYRFKKRYQVTAVTRSPDSDLPMKIAAMPTCTFDRFYTADNLNHYVFNLFF